MRPSSIKVSSPVPYACGAYVAHKSLEPLIRNYSVTSYNPYWSLFPPAIRRYSDPSADVIHAPIDYAIFSRLHNKPLVSTFHGFVLDPYIYNHVSLLRRIHYQTDLRWFVLQALKYSNAITCVSKYLVQMARDELGYRGDIRVIYNGIDIDKFRPHKKKNSGGGIRVLYCGGPGKRKGADLIPAIMDRTGSEVTFVYTSGLKTDRGFLRHPRANYLGKVSHDGMPELFNDVDVLLFPSFREGFGLAVAEAMACGLPVVTTDCSALPELIDEGRGGYLCAPGASGMFAAKLNLLAQSSQLRREMGEYNRDKVERLFTLAHMARAYQQLFEEVISRK